MNNTKTFLGIKISTKNSKWPLLSLQCQHLPENASSANNKKIQRCKETGRIGKVPATTLKPDSSHPTKGGKPADKSHRFSPFGVLCAPSRP